MSSTRLPISTARNLSATAPPNTAPCGRRSAGWSSRALVSSAPAQAGPRATLLINDYRTDPDYEKVIEQLVDGQGSRLYDVIGIQSHMHSGTWPTEKVWEMCERFARFGVPLHFTETTILSGEKGWERSQPWPSTPEGEAMAGPGGGRGSTRSCSPTQPSRPSPGGTSATSTPGKGPQPVSAARHDPQTDVWALKDLIKGKWWTKTALQTDAKGEARLRGFLGDYSIKVKFGEREAKENVSLRKGATDPWRIQVP